MKRTRNTNFLGLVVSGFFVLTSPFVSMAIAQLEFVGAVHGVATLEPVDKARLLAERISETLNAFAFGAPMMPLGIVLYAGGAAAVPGSPAASFLSSGNPSAVRCAR